MLNMPGDWEYQHRKETRIHRTALIAPEAQIGGRVTIGPFSSVGPGAQIGEGCFILGAAVNGIVGNRSTLWRGVNLMFDTQIGECVQMCENSSVLTGGRVGNNCSIQIGTSIARTARVGDNVFIGPYVVFANHRHPKVDTPPTELEPITIGNDVMIGTHSVLIGPLMIGDGAFIRAGSIVTRNVPPGGKV